MSAPPVVFDLDGTLIHSAPDIHAAVARMLAAEGLAPLPLATVTGFIGNGVAVLVAKVIAATGLDPALQPRLLTRFQQEYDRAPSQLTRVFDGVPEALAGLRAGGHRLGVCTNKPVATARAVLVDLGLLPLFATVIGGDSLPQRKPDPAPLHAALAALGSGEGLYIGDSEVDAATAAAAGVPFFLFTGGYRASPVEAFRHAAPFDRFADLPALLAAARVPQ